MQVGGNITIGGGIKLGDFSINTPIQFTTTFTSSTTWTLPANAILLNASMLLIGAGGGGGTINTGYSYDCAGGGGAGGYVFVSDMIDSIIPGVSYTITVGATTAAQTTGQNSSAFGFIAYGGGRGGSINSGISQDGGNGGSGGGASSHASTFQSGGTGVTGQGYAGAEPRNIAYGSSYAYLAGGGGGAGGAPNTAGSDPRSDYGGPGIVNTITGSSQTYCAGGNGQYWVQSTATRYDGAPTTNYGSGGSGTYSANAATKGKPGACILKYTYILR
jgi:hypothetical protein